MFRRLAGPQLGDTPDEIDGSADTEICDEANQNAVVMHLRLGGLGEARWAIRQKWDLCFAKTTV